MAKVNMSYKFRALNGKPISRDTGETRKIMKDGKQVEEPITTDLDLKHICVDALFNPELGVDGRPVQVEGQEKFDRYYLASRLYSSNGIVELKSEQITLLKDLIGKGYGPIIIGQAWEALEGKRGLKAKETIPDGKK